MHFESFYPPAFLDNVFKKFSGVEAYHEAFPNLMMFPNFAFHNQKEKKILQKIFEAARIELMLNAFIKEKIFIETNHCLVFFAYQISELFPKAKFVHITRHPGDFVRSAIMKGWHKNDTIWENNRIRMGDHMEWETKTQIEKLSWLWNSTHSYIDNFLNTVPNERLTVKLEELTSSKSKFNEMTAFLNKDFVLDNSLVIKIQSEKINELFIGNSEPDNMFKLANYPKYGEWNDDLKGQLRSNCAKLATEYEYII